MDIAGSLVAGPAVAETLADVPPREDGADLSRHSERSKYAETTRIPEAGPGKRNVDPSEAIGAWIVIAVLSLLLVATGVTAHLGWAQDANVPTSGYVAMAFGVIFSLIVGIGLMTLFFTAAAPDMTNRRF